MIWIALSLVSTLAACLAWLCYEKRERIIRLERNITLLHDINQGLLDDIKVIRVAEKARLSKPPPSIVSFDGGEDG